MTKEQRRAAKAVNFGLIYGMSAFGLAKQLGVERKIAQHYIDTYFARYPGVAAYMAEAKETAKAKGYVETIFTVAFTYPIFKPKMPPSEPMQNGLPLMHRYKGRQLI